MDIDNYSVKLWLSLLFIFVSFSATHAQDDVRGEGIYISNESALDYIYGAVIDIILGLISLLVGYIFELSGIATVIIFVLILLLIKILIKFAPKVIKYYYEHPIIAALVSFALLAVFIALAVIYETYIAGTAAVLTGSFVLLVLIAALLIIFALVVDIIGLIGIVVKLIKKLRDLICKKMLICVKYVVKHEKTCTKWRKSIKRECAHWKSVEKKTCVKREYGCRQWAERKKRECCTWWPCSWGCKVVYTVVSVVCVAYGWICKVWKTFREKVCIAWRTIAEYVCIAYMWVLRKTCRLFRWVLRCK